MNLYDDDGYYVPGSLVRQRNRKGRSRRLGIYFMRMIRSWVSR